MGDKTRSVVFLLLHCGYRLQSALVVKDDHFIEINKSSVIANNYDESRRLSAHTAPSH